MLEFAVPVAPMVDCRANCRAFGKVNPTPSINRLIIGINVDIFKIFNDWVINKIMPQLPIQVAPKIIILGLVAFSLAFIKFARAAIKPQCIRIQPQEVTDNWK